MCLLFIYINPNPKEGHYKLIIVNNRDESFTRPTERATIWPENPRIVAGTDQTSDRSGGTWLGLSANGSVASVLNIFQPKGAVKDPSVLEGRGFLVVDYLRSTLSAEEYMRGVIDSDKDYNLFNLVILEPGNPYRLLFLNYADKEVVHLGPGCHSFGNCYLNKPFRKVEQGKTKLEDIVKDIGTDIVNEEQMLSSLFKMMEDKTECFPDAVIDSQGKGYPESFLRGVSSTCVNVPSANYGTRTTSVILVDADGRAIFKEKTMEEPIQADMPQWLTSTYVVNMKK